MMTNENARQSIDRLSEKSTVVEKLEHVLLTPIRDFVLDLRYRVIVFMACLTLIMASAMVWAPAPEVRLPSPDFWGKVNGFNCVLFALGMIFSGLAPRLKGRPVLQLVQILVILTSDATLMASGFTILCVGLGHVGPQNVFQTHVMLSLIPVLGMGFPTMLNIYLGTRKPE